MESASIPELIERSIAGERQAQETLIRITQNHIYYHCIKMLKNEADAQDMAQEILIAMLKGLTILRNPAAFWGWLNAITANQCRNVLAEQGRGDLPLEETNGGASEWLEEQNAQLVPDQALDNEEARQMVLGLIDALPPSQRLCVLMYYYDEMSVKDISAALDVPEGTVKSRLNYARKAIKKDVERYAEQGIQLYALTPFPYLLYILRQDALRYLLDEETSQRIIAGVLSGAAAAAGGAAGLLAAHKGALTLAGIILAGVVAGTLLLHPAPSTSPAPTPTPTPSATPAPTPAPTPTAAPTPTPTPDPTPTPVTPGVESGITFGEEITSMATTSEEYIMRPMRKDGTFVWDPLVWGNLSPDLISFDKTRMCVKALGKEGIAYLSATLGDDTAYLTIHIVPEERLLKLSSPCVFMDIGSSLTTKPIIKGTRFAGEYDTAEWIADNEDMVDMKVSTQNDEPKMVVYALKTGVCHITCQLTLADGTTAEAYCTVIAYDENPQDKPIPEPTPTPTPEPAPTPTPEEPDAESRITFGQEIISVKPTTERSISKPMQKDGCPVTGPIIWENLSPDLIYFDEEQLYLKALGQVGTAYLRATVGDDTAYLEIHIVPKDGAINLSVGYQMVDVGRSVTTKLLTSGTKFAGVDYTTEWYTVREDLVALSGTTSNGAPALVIQTIEPGVAHITCKATLADGTSAEAYCTVIICDEAAEDQTGPEEETAAGIEGQGSGPDGTNLEPVPDASMGDAVLPDGPAMPEPPEQPDAAGGNQSQGTVNRKPEKGDEDASPDLN